MKFSPRRCLTYGFLLSILSGCSWFSTTPEAPRPNPLPNFQARLQLINEWQTPLGTGIGDSDLRLADYGTGIFAATRDGQVVRLDEQSGRISWRVAVGKSLSAGVGAGDGVAVVVTQQGHVIALNAENGSQRWEYTLNTEVLAAPLAVDGFVIVRASDGRLFGLDSATGNLQWQQARTLPALTLRSAAGMVSAGGAVFAGFAGGKLVGMNLSNGLVGWEANVAFPKGATEIERISDITSEPVLNELNICAIAYQGRLACFEPRSGNLLWARDIASLQGLSSGTRTLYTTTSTESIMAFDRQTGANLWKQDQLARRGLTRPAALPRAVLVGDAQGWIHALDSDNGTFLARLNTDNSGLASPPLVSDNVVYWQSRQGTVYRTRLD